MNFAHAVLRLFTAVRYRKNLVAAILAAAVLLGGLYYATAAPATPPRPSWPSRPSTWFTCAAASSARRCSRRRRRTSRRTSSALRCWRRRWPRSRPATCPPLAALSARGRIESLRLKVETKVYRQTNVLEVGYVSKDPRAAAKMVEAIVEAFKWFEEELQRTDMKQRFESLTKDQEQTIAELKRVKQQGIEARGRMKYQPLGVTPEGSPSWIAGLEEAAKIHGQYIDPENPDREPPADPPGAGTRGEPRPAPAGDR